MRSNCLRWSTLEKRHVLACWDDLCHGSDQTLCGLWEGHDFNTAEDDEYYDEDDWEPWDETPATLPGGHKGALDG